jgi:CO/xanthine dehydrogenase FAD-binding subunit
MIPPFGYKTPNTIEEAIELLRKVGREAKIIAGGTDLVIGLRNADHALPFIIDITRIEELRKIEEMNGTLSIGAAVTHSEISSSPLVKKYGRVLSDASSEIGSPQIRNLGTIGGNIVNASPSADTIPPLMVLNAMGKVVSKEGEKQVPLSQLFMGPYKTSLKPHELLVQIIFPKLSPDIRTSYVRLARRDAMAIARMSVAVILQIEKDRIKDMRISVGSVTPTPQRMTEAEDFLKGKSPHRELLQKASFKITEAMIQQSGIRPSTSYKKPVVEALFMRAMRKVLEEET